MVLLALGRLFYHELCGLQMCGPRRLPIVSNSLHRAWLLSGTTPGSKRSNITSKLSPLQLTLHCFC
jgi:hypothetical protein